MFTNSTQTTSSMHILIWDMMCNIQVHDIGLLLILNKRSRSELIAHNTKYL